jgi:nucleoside-diphosphate-sugar epimerase
MKTILITGHEGFIGRNTVKLLKDKYEFVLYPGDIREFAFDGHCDLVLHLAALAGVRASWQDPEAYWATNVMASQLVFNWATENNKKVFYASSSSIYEWWLNPYATTKKSMEQLSPTNSTGMRFHTVWGSDSRPDMFYDMMIKGKIQYLTTHERDWTHVEDVVSAIDLLINLDQTPRYLDIGTGTVTRVDQFAQSRGFGHLPIKETTGERLHTQADISFLQSHGWMPTKNIMRDG